MRLLQKDLAERVRICLGKFSYRPFKTLCHTINIIRNLSEYILALFLLDGRKLLFTFTGQYNCRCLFRKIKQFHASKVVFFFQKRFSLSDLLNVINTNIDICFDNILAKTKRKNGHHKAILRLHGCL